MKRSYSTAELAKMWDVSESTIKRWADAGLLRCSKTAGGHRKFDLNAILDFQNRSGLVGKAAVIERELADTDGDLERLLSASDFDELARRYKQAALSGKSQAASAMLRRAYLHGVSLAKIGEAIIRPAMFEVGELWRTGKIQVLDEHLATFATLRGIRELQSVAANSNGSGKLAIVGCSEGEFHCVGASLVHCLLEAEGWKVINLGQHTPLISLADAVPRFTPSVICLSLTMVDHIECVSRDYERLSRVALKHRARVVMGGAALEDAGVRERFAGAVFALTLPDLLQLIDQHPGEER
jgi:methanogenic corrinoid protein MtbC1